jgi:hypothetical protein
MSTHTQDQLKQEAAIYLARALCIRSFERACMLCGGGSWDSLRGKSFMEVVDTMAHNGLAFTYEPEQHLDTISAKLDTYFENHAKEIPRLT